MILIKLVFLHKTHDFNQTCIPALTHDFNQTCIPAQNT